LNILIGKAKGFIEPGIRFLDGKPALKILAVSDVLGEVDGSPACDECASRDGFYQEF